MDPCAQDGFRGCRCGIRLGESAWTVIMESLTADAKSDLVNVLARLEAHWVVLEAELVEINKDMTYCEQCVHKYG